jgi:hypothetical protein
LVAAIAPWREIIAGVTRGLRATMGMNRRTIDVQ